MKFVLILSIVVCLAMAVVHAEEDETEDPAGNYGRYGLGLYGRHGMAYGRRGYGMGYGRYGRYYLDEDDDEITKDNGEGSYGRCKRRCRKHHPNNPYAVRVCKRHCAMGCRCKHDLFLGCCPKQLFYCPPP